MPIFNTVYGGTWWWGGGWQPWENTLLYLPFSTDLNDHSGNSHNPSTYSSASITTLNGVKCCYFNDGAMQIPQFTTFNHSFTISLWYNITNVYGAQIANQWQAGSSKLMSLWLQAQRGRIGLGFYGNDYETTTVPATNTWVHIVATFNRDNNYWVIYYNWNSIGSHTYSTPNVQSWIFYIWPNAEAPSNTTWRMRGYVSNYIVEDKARTEQEITDYYNQTKWNYWL